MNIDSTEAPEASETLVATCFFLVAIWLLGDLDDEEKSSREFLYVCQSIERCKAFDVDAIDVPALVDGIRSGMVELTQQEGRYSELANMHARLLAHGKLSKTAFAICLDYILWSGLLDSQRISPLNEICEAANLNFVELVKDFSPAYRALTHSYDE